jgi:hypothetical protein
MAKYDQEDFVDDTVNIDGNWYIACRFTRCRLVYSGGPLPTLQSCSYWDCEWELAEQAGRVLILLRAMHAYGLAPAKEAIKYIQGSPTADWLRTRAN